MNNVDDLLRRSKAFHDLFADCLFADPGNEVLRDLVVYVRVQECHAHLAHSVLDVLFVKLAASLEFAENAVELARKSLESHVLTAFISHEW